MTGSKLAAVILTSVGFVFSVVGAMVGVLSHQAGFIDCGSGFSPNPDIIYTTECYGMTDSARTLALVLLIPGVLAFLVGMIMALAGSQMFKRVQLSDVEDELPHVA
jgi:hypothetical protein